MQDTKHYAHVLLFACPQCGRPIATACLSSKKNLEIAEAKWFNPTCYCGWKGDISGVTAWKHWVEPWDLGLAPGEAGSCEEQGDIIGKNP